jgi:hypothetical protein
MPRSETSCTSHAPSGIRSGTRVTYRAGILEIISPGGFERFFAEMADASEAGRCSDPTDIGARSGLEFDLGSVERFCDEHGLTHRAPEMA